jgi:hypothetical protein
VLGLHAFGEPDGEDTPTRAQSADARILAARRQRLHGAKMAKLPENSARLSLSVPVKKTFRPAQA